MKQIYYSLSVFLLIVAMSAGSVFAQRDTTKLNQSVEVMKAYHPSISNANKVNLLPVVSDTTRFTPEFKYSIDSQPVKTGFAASPIGAADVNGRPDKDLGPGFLKLGAGTYSTLYGEFFLNLPKSNFATFGLHLRHLSSDGKIKLREGDLVDAPYSQNNAAIFGALNVGELVLSTDLTYNRDAVRYYGYPVTIPANSVAGYGLKQVYQGGDIKVVLKNNEKSQSEMKFNSGFHLGFFDSKTGQKETNGGFFGKFDYNFGEVRGILDLSYDHLATDSINIGSPAVPRSKTEGWLKIAPSVRLDGDNWSLRGGIKFIAVQDKVEGNSTKLYPDFEFNFRPIEGILTLYAGFNGDFKSNRYSDIANENYWADPRHNVRKTDYSYIVSGGLKGKLTREISYNVGMKYSKAKDLYFYVQNSFDDFSSSTYPAPVIYNNAFDLAYDNAGIFNLSTEFSYVSGKDLSVVLKGNYYNYTLESLPFAPQKPNFDMTASAGFRIIDRLTGFTDLEVIGKRKALVKYFSPLSSAIPADKVFSMDPSVRLNIGATYEMTSKFKLFGRVDNLLNMQNEQWLGYTSQGLRLLAGVTYSF